MIELIKELELDKEIERIALAVQSGERIGPKDGVKLLESAPLALLGALANAIKERKSGKHVYYNRNIHVEPTNICVFRCKFCSYRRASIEDPGAWYYTIDDIRHQVAMYKDSPITEVHIVGGVHPKHTLDDYVDMVRAVKEVLPNVVVKAYTAVELHYIISRSSLTIEQGLRRLKEAGMEAIPGGGAEIFAPEIRDRICGDKSTAEQWLETHREAHKLGISTNATILYGHVESYEHRIAHLEELRQLQDETHGFSAFIPLKFRSANNLMSSAGEVPLTEDMRMLALSRIYLDNFDHIKAYWVMLGKQATELALSFGADDIDGTIDDTTKIYSMAGADDQKPQMTTDEMQALIRRAGYIPAERDTFYNVISR